MFIEELASGGSDAAIRAELDGFLSTLTGLSRSFSYSIGHRGLSQVPSTYVDIYPSEWTEKYDSFGGLYVRAWRVGDPAHLVYGIFLGAERAEQAEPRRAARFIRQRISPVLLPFEARHGFHYKAWTTSDIDWKIENSPRAPTRQMEQFVTFKKVSPIDASAIEVEIRDLVKLLDEALSLIGPTRQFGVKIIELYYGDDLPQEAPMTHDALPAEANGLSETGDEWNADIGVNWSLADTPSWESLRGLEEPFHQAIAALRAGKHVIFLGPPGSGKTELAEFICKTLAQKFRSVTATSEWGAFETIGGYLPTPAEGNASTVALDFNPGLVVQALENREWLILDELNRADLDKCFGELFTLLGGGQKSVRLPYKRRSPDDVYRQVVLSHAPKAMGDDTILIPSSWRIIGTMNTTDKASLYQLSYAFMRRFAFINVGVPTADDYNNILSSALSAVDEKVSTSALAGILTALFASAEAGTLRSVGIEFGPALALDVIRYLASRSATLDDSVSLVEEALELLVFPQMEGMRQKYPEITTALNAALGRPLKRDADRSLRMWTGHYE